MLMDLLSSIKNVKIYLRSFRILHIITMFDVTNGIILPAPNHFKTLSSPNVCLKLHISKHVMYIHIYLVFQCSKYIRVYRFIPVKPNHIR